MSNKIDFSITFGISLGILVGAIAFHLLSGWEIAKYFYAGGIGSLIPALAYLLKILISIKD